MNGKSEKTTAEDLEYRSQNLRQWANEYAELAKRLRELDAEIAESGGAQFETSVRRPLEANIRRIEGRIDAIQRAAQSRMLKPEAKAMAAESPTEYVVEKQLSKQSKKGKAPQ